jgi:hypothetical protein
MNIRRWRFLAALILIAFGLSPARAEWRRAESANFIVYANASEATLRQRITRLEEFDRLLRIIVAVQAPAAANKLHVYYVSGNDELNMIHRLGPGVAGFYTASPDGVAAFVDGSVRMGDDEVLLHEYAHHFMLQYSANPYPAWYVEGFAEYFMTADFNPRAIDIGKASAGRVYSVAQGPWLPMERVLSGGSGNLSREQMAAYYAQSWLLTHYFYSTPERQAALGRLLIAARGGTPVAALRSATGLTPDALTAELRRYIRGGQISYRRMERTAPAPPTIAIAAMPRSAQDLILFEAALRVGIPAERRQAYLQQIRTAAARHPDDPLAMRVLAHAEALHGDGAAAERLLDRLLAATPNDAQLMYLKGMRFWAAAESDNPPANAARDARIWFTRAHRADGNHYQTLYRYAQSLRSEPNFVSENTSNVLMLAHQLAPQVHEITMNAAALMISRREWDQAAMLLRPLAVDPHDSGMARAARQMLAMAQARGEVREADPTPDPAPVPLQPPG